MDTPIELKVTPLEGVKGGWLVRFEGDLDATNVEKTLEEINDLFDKGYTKIVADFKDLTYVNSTGLGILLHISRAATEKGGCFKISNINENVYEIIEIIGATSLLDIFESVEKAVASIS